MKQLIILALTIGLSINATKAEDQKPIFVINGIEVVSWSDVQNIDSEKIESITVYKGAEASLFSEFGDTSYGVIEITLNGENGPVLLDAEIMPTFMNGDINTFRSWVMQNVRYPAEAIDKLIQGVVIAQFVVGTDGHIIKDKVKIISDTDPLLNNEVIRVLNLSPRWTPGNHAGKSVAVQFLIPVSFGLSVN